nr:protein ALP1-like isoform X1 [Tanacetum cinerariifolium]
MEAKVYLHSYAYSDAVRSNDWQDGRVGWVETRLRHDMYQWKQARLGESSRPSHKAINHDRYVAEARLLADYFGPSPKYPDYYFRCRYRMNRSLFLEIFQGVIKKYPTIMLEVVASYDLWIWYAFFGVACTNNDLTVLNHSPLFDDLLDDISLVVPFEVNGVTFEKGYYLANGIYPQWAAFVKSFTVARDERNAVFKRRQESARNDVKRAFGVLQGRRHIIAQPVLAWIVNKLRRIMYTCIILHNMILKNQKFALSDIGDTYICPRANLARTWIERCEVQRKQAQELRDKQTHAWRQRNLIEHVWQQHLLND